MTSPDPIVWRGMTRAELDAAYNNSAAVAGSARHVADWSERSAALRSRHPDLLDRPYGPRDRNRIDILRSGAADAPLLVFFHGGYWQRNAKEVFTCMAAGPLAHGIDVALPGYTLAPDATLTEIGAETGEALRWLRREGPAIGVARGPLIASGWSAGGHLAALAMDRPEVDAGLAISGIFDLEPCRLNYLNEKLRLSIEEVRELSPLERLPTSSGPLAVAYGARELPELRRQSEDFAAAWSRAGLTGTLQPVPDHDHFSVLDELEQPDGRLVTMLLALVQSLPSARG
jgi:acetyl esterase/lipase